jgi:hypothetical protein
VPLLGPIPRLILFEALIARFQTPAASSGAAEAGPSRVRLSMPIQISCVLNDLAARIPRTERGKGRAFK